MADGWIGWTHLLIDLAHPMQSSVLRSTSGRHHHDTISITLGRQWF